MGRNSKEREERSDFINRIEEFRIKKKLSRAKLGEAIGVTDRTIYNWEKGKRPIPSDGLIALSRELKTSTDNLLGLLDK